MKTFTLTESAQCNNCQRIVVVGEMMTAESLEAVMNGAGLCTTCAPITTETKEKKKKVSDGD